MQRILIMCIVLVLAAIKLPAQDTIETDASPQFLFSMSAKSGSFDGESLILRDSPSVIYFSNRPNRITGQMSLEEFVKGWEDGENSFKSDAPNATLTTSSTDGEKEAVIELNSAKYKDGDITFAIKILMGEVPESFKVSSLFVDSGGAPMPFCFD